MRTANTQLKRSIGLTGMVFFGVGTMIGGGFYALLGKIVAQAGVFTPLCLLLARFLAATPFRVVSSREQTCNFIETTYPRTNREIKP